MARPACWCPRGDPMAGAVERLLADPALAARLGIAARHRVQARFAPDASVERLPAI